MKGKIQYKKFLDEIYNNKPIEDYPLLEKYRKNIRILLSEYPIDEYIDNNYALWSNYIEMAIKLSIKMEDRIINYKLINMLFGLYIDVPKPLELIHTLESVYCPQKMEDFDGYLDGCRFIYSLFLFHDEKDNLANVSIEELCDFYKFMGSLDTPIIPYQCEVELEEGTISYLFAYLHYHGIKDYSLIVEYLNNIDYYKEKMILNNCLVFDEEADGGYGEFNYKEARVLFDHVLEFFIREKGSIK